ncbi:NEL-type E3 ubiquitin ligase domain-containing protein [Pseudomonas xanthosomatis]|uniref:NEL-type E3 ubiquitin ligase domain-containing protein n=1 Tax=Pseudomonas xanthosomatis TaxID=2842356 RepID=UPI003511482D
MTDIAIPYDSIDAFIASRLPAWLRQADASQLTSLNRALREQQACAEKLAPLLQAVPSLEAFAAPLLQKALEDAGLGRLDVRRCKVHVSLDAELPSASTHLKAPRRTFQSTQSLLACALHNFHESETRPSIFRRTYLSDENGKPLALGFEAFAGLCRKLDLGGSYQFLLKLKFEPTASSSPGDHELERQIEENLRAQLEVAVRMARARRQIDEQTYYPLLAIFAARPVVPSAPQQVVARQLYLLGRKVRGVVALEVRDAPGQPVTGVIAWIPGDEQQPVSRHASWAALYQSMAERLLQPAFRAFFGRFISERDRPKFFGRLKALQRVAEPGSAVELDGRNLAIDGKLFAHLRALQLEKLLDDARVLAVPTGDEDEVDRHERLEGMIAAGFDLLALAGAFVPVLGQVMLAVTAVQVAEQVYEGYEDWAIGDREGALDHLFGVAQSLAVGVVVGKAGSVALGLTRRLPFIDGLVPLRTDSGQARLASGALDSYRLQDRELAVGQQVRTGDAWRLRLHDGAYQVSQDPASEQWSIEHPQRPRAYAPRLEHNGSGGWHHELERPQQWQGCGSLLRRLDRQLAALSDQGADELVEQTGFDEARLRQLHLENAQPPARLLDACERRGHHLQFPALRGAAFEGYLAERERVPGRAASLLRRDFPGLTVRGAEEIVGQANTVQVDGMLDNGRVPLALAERARWYLRDSRLDRACAGLRLPQAVNADCERLALGLVERLAPWPATVRIELREGQADGVLLASQGDGEAGSVRCIVKLRAGYALQDGPGAALATSRDSLVRALWLSLDDGQKTLLGLAGEDDQALAARLGRAASADREQAAGLIGMAPLGRGVRPPRRLADGRVGYPLSGRGESSRQAIRQGIHQIFPTLTNLQMEAYVLDLLSRRVDLWEHYTLLQRHLAALREQLRAWRDLAPNPLELLRRQRVSDTIRRSWRRKLVDLAGDPVLVIEGERVGHLPVLPPGVDFSHVRRLVLRNMGLAAVDADFLGRFPNLVELDLRQNALEAIPAGVEQLTQLRQLHLARNQITLNTAGNARLAALSRLNTLDLSHNPLGQAPDLAGLRHLRRVLLRATGLEALPAPARRLSWRGLADLRDNSIRQLRLDLNTLRQRLGRLSLHDNPLDEADEALLEQASGVREPHGAHAAADRALRELWLGHERGEVRARRQAVWDALQAEPDSADLFRFLNDFAQIDDFDEYPEYYRDRVWHILEACHAHEPLRLRLFSEASGPRTCEDRLLLTLSQFELAVLAEQAVYEGPQAQVEGRLVQLGRSLLRLDELDRFATRHVQALLERDIALVDEIEVRLYLRIRLAAALRLPAQPAAMHYESFAKVTTSDIRRAQAQVLATETRERVIESLAQRPFWERYVREHYLERLETLAEPFHQRLEVIEAAVGETGEQLYLEQSNALMAELERAERALIHTLAQEAYERSNP